MIKKGSKFFWSSVMDKYGWSARLFDYNCREDIDGIINLVRSQYPYSDEGYPEYLRWEYYENPMAKSIIWVAEHNGEIVGQYVVNLMKIKVGEKIRNGSVAVKTLVRKDFRGKGIYLYLADKVFQECREQDIQFTYGFPNEDAYKPCIERLGFMNIGKVPLLVRPFGIKKLIEECIRNKTYSRILSLLILPFGNVYNFIFAANLFGREKRKISIKQIDCFDDRIDAFWEEIKTKHRNMQVRNSKFLNWRYCNNPRREYQIFIAENANREIISYIVLRVSYIDKIKVGYIADILSKECKLGNLACFVLIQNAINYFVRQSVDIVCCLMLRNKIYFNFLRKNGFLVCPDKLLPQPFNFLIKAHDNVPDYIYRLDDWFVTLGDYDVV